MIGITEFWFHGTDALFEKFDTKGLGSHFGNAEQALSSPGGKGFIKVVRLELKSLFRMADMYSWDPIDILPILEKRLNLDLYDIEFRIMMLGHKYDVPSFQEEIKDLLKSHGYDGIIYSNIMEGAGDSVIVFDSKQIEIMEVRTIKEHWNKLYKN